MNKNKLLIFTDWFEPGYKAGGPIRSVANLVKLLELDIDIYIFTSDRDFQETSGYKGIQPNHWLNYSLKSHVFYASPQFLTYKNIKKIIDAVSPMTILLNSLWSISYTLLPLIATKHLESIITVLSPRGMLKPSALSIKRYKKNLYLFLFKNFINHKKLLFHSTCYEETFDIKKVFKNEIVTIGNVPEVRNYFRPISKNVKSLKLIYISRIHPIKNILFLINAFENLSTTFSLTLNIFGPVEDKQYYESCLLGVQKINKSVTINFLGALEHHKINQNIQEHHFFILPTLGENFGHAIFEAFEAGRPVIISDQTPWLNLEDKKVGFDLPLNYPELWLKTIEKCAQMDQTEFDEWCKASHNFAKVYIFENNLKDKYLQLFS